VHAPALKGAPQLRGTVTRIFVIEPRKPNSANRHCARVKLSNGHEVTALIPGEHVRLQEHNVVLVQAGKAPDLGGVKYRIIRGALDDAGDQARQRSRSRYGSKK
jgi:small subunit ribosomal protein S12